MLNRRSSPIPDSYDQWFESVLSASMWSNASNIPAMTRWISIRFFYPPPLPLSSSFAHYSSLSLSSLSLSLEVRIVLSFIFLECGVVFFFFFFSRSAFRRLLCSFIRKCSEKVSVASFQERTLGAAQNLLSFKAYDHFGFEILRGLVDSLPLYVFSVPYFFVLVFFFRVWSSPL